jgi:hypothetical protein
MSKLRKYVAESVLLLEYDRDKTIQRHGSSVYDRAIHVAHNDENAHPVEVNAGVHHSRNQSHKGMAVVMDHIEKTDPTPNKQYVQHVARMYGKGGVKMEDMHSRMTPALEKFHDLSRRKIIPAEHRDLGRYKTLSDLEDVVEKHAGSLSGKEENRQLHDKMKSPEHSSSEDYHTFTKVTPKTQEASCHFGKGTRWCTAADNNNMFPAYNKLGPMHIYTPKTPAYPGEKYQYHYGTNSLMNEKDHEVSIRDVARAHPEMGNNIALYKQHADSAMSNPTMDHPETKVRGAHAANYASAEELHKHLEDSSEHVYYDSALKNPNFGEEHRSKLRERISKLDNPYYTTANYYSNHATSDELHDLYSDKHTFKSEDIRNAAQIAGFDNTNFDHGRHGQHFTIDALRKNNIDSEVSSWYGSDLASQDHIKDIVKNYSMKDSKKDSILRYVQRATQSGNYYHVMMKDDETRELVKSGKAKHPLFNNHYWSRFASAQDIHDEFDKPDTDSRATNIENATNNKNFDASHFEKSRNLLSREDHARMTANVVSKVDPEMINKDDLDNMMSHRESATNFPKYVRGMYHTSEDSPLTADHFKSYFKQFPKSNYYDDNEMLKHSYLKPEHVYEIAAHHIKNNDVRKIETMLPAHATDPERYGAIKKAYADHGHNFDEVQKKIMDRNLNNIDSWNTKKPVQEQTMLKKYVPTMLTELKYQTDPAQYLSVTKRATKRPNVIQRHNQREKSMYHTTRTNMAHTYGFRAQQRGNLFTDKSGNRLTDRIGQERRKRVQQLRSKHIGESAYIEKRKMIHDMHAEVGKSLAGKERHPELKVMDLHRSKKHAHAALVLDRLLTMKTKKK